MPVFEYTAMTSKGEEEKGTLEVGNQSEAVTKLKEMGFFPTKVVEVNKGGGAAKGGGKAKGKSKAKKGGGIQIKIPGFGGKVKNKVLTTFTRQLATLVDAGLPLLRGLRVLQKQEKNVTLREITEELAIAIEGGATFSEALAQHPKTFNKLFINMVKAGELGGVLEVVLNRLAEFMEKAEKIKGKVKAAMFYPVAVLIVAVGILALLMIMVVPKFEAIFADMLGDEPLPKFTRIVLAISAQIKDNTIETIIGVVLLYIIFKLITRTQKGQFGWHKFLLIMPVLGPVISKVSIARFSRTLGTLISSGVPILQSLAIVKDTSGNVVIAGAVQGIHESVKEGETIVAPLEESKVFPPIVISMVDVGEQTGALPEMLMKIADNYDEEVDNAVAAMTSLLEPIMIVCLAVIVGSIVIALFLPLIVLMDKMS
ncbi:type II secretion system F family protein [Verrucomicrobia bacterium]|nr:type II secretion system F family protein [Verrucomicrobiota bacterium]